MSPIERPFARITWRDPVAASCFALLAVVIAVGVVWMPAELYPGDPMTMREETRALVLHGNLAVSESVADNYRRIGECGQYVVDNPRNGRAYSKYGTMTAVFYVMPMALELLVEGSLPAFTSPHRLLYLNGFNIALSCLVALSLHRTARRFGAGPWIATAYVLACFYTTFLWNYLRAQNSEIMQLLLFAWAVTAFLDVIDDREGRPSAWPVARLWLACTALLLMKVAYIFIGPLFALALAVHRHQTHKVGWLAAFWREGLVHVLPALGCVAAWATINWIKFGAPWSTGYHVWRTETTTLFAGDLGRALYDLAFSPRWGLLYLFPVLVLALPWIGPWLAKRPVAYGGILGIAAVYTILVGSMISWRGELTYGPRYWVFILPLVSLPALDAIRWLARRDRAALVTAAGVACMLTHSLVNQMAVNRHTFFAFYDLLSPLYHVLGTESAEFFLDSSYGHVLREFESQFPELRWWEDMRSKIPPEAAKAYETHVARVLSRSNLYWFQ